MKLRDWITFSIVLFALGSPRLALAERDASKVFFFGNSLVQHSSASPQTSTVYWLGVLSDAADKNFAADGMFGFLREFGKKLPPEPQWSVPGVDGAWRRSFGGSGYDAVVLTPTNFIQYKPADQPYDWQNPDNITPLDASRQVLDWVQAATPDARLFIYEGWADMGDKIRSFPPSARQLRKYHRINGGDYHDWYEDYVAMLARAYPQNPPRLIPVASVLSNLFQMSELDELQATDLYSDDAPHGTPSLYFLAAMVSYAALYDVAPPASVDLPDTIHPLIRSNYAVIVDQIAASIGVKHAALNFHQAPAPQQPSLAMGLAGVHDWGTQYPFLNVMKTARPWLGHLPGQWGGFDAARLEAEGYLDEHGWPMEIPAEVDKLESYLLTDLPSDARYFAGRYRLTYDGRGTLRIGGRAQQVKYSEGQIEFSFKPGEGPVVITLSKTDPSDHIRNIAIVQQHYAPLFDMGAVFNPQWAGLLKDLRVIRFMDWGLTNGSDQVHWRDRAQVDDYTYGRRGVPIELMIQLANTLAVDPWFCLPHKATDSYVEAYATLVRDQLEPRRRAYVEYSNELWNFLFPQAKYAVAQARAAWGTEIDAAWMQWAGMRAAQVMDIWADVFNDSDRLTRVIGVHTGWPGLEEAALMAPLANLSTPPVQSFDAYAVTGYFGIEAGMDDMPKKVLAWHKQGVVTKKLTEFLRHGPLRTLLTEQFPYHAKVARSHDLELVMYEGGSHILGMGEWADDATLTNIFAKYNYSPEMAGLYAELLSGWRAAGGTLFNAFVDVDKPSKWGSWGAKRHLEDKNPRWDALIAYNTSHAADWEARAQDSFDSGVFLIGQDGDDLLDGTRWSDILIGHRGNDRLIAAGGGDFLLGGDGVDTAVFPGRSEEYELAFLGDSLLLIGGAGETALHGVERLEFTEEPGQSVELSLPN